ncbi:serine-threonine protein kinase, putative [Entamoeba dispar SAW760]|uniref:receptor protein serine/threonine kinase n=1 Tax=Entamoeba dispar (strain ATCC PRA-260 / SAW760) TaxID=370354 RepID=B0EGJ1_ENTDS|nr:serine-threonine protein kinase, putative [Entamoeba dispar SAW760]EDR26370.1 serine-threonine protein kinase, putative [Entamoeba dispar SAW760]|eukprot:EDR26370.1 serine-threonine protein kinase, putative [Entamoeba dispar SAW760]
MAEFQIDNLDSLIESENVETIRNYFKKKNPKEIKDILTKQVSILTVAFPISYSIVKKRIQSFNELLDIYIKNKLDINQQDDGGLTILHYAVQSKDSRFITTLLSIPGINPYAPDNDGQSPFIYFLRFHDEPTIVECLEAFIKCSRIILNSRIASGRYKGDFPINIAFQNQRSCGILLETFLKNGAVPDVTNFSNDVPLLYAVQKKRLDLVLLLLKFGARIYIANNAGNSPLSVAMKTESKITSVFSLVDSIHIKMRNEFSLTLQYDLPRMIGIGLFTDVSTSQAMRNMINMGVNPDTVKRFMEVCRKTEKDFMESRDAFDLLYYKEDEGELEEEKKIDVKSIEFLGESIGNKNKLGMGLYGEVVRARYKGKTIGIEYIRLENEEKTKLFEEHIEKKLSTINHENILQIMKTLVTDNSIWIMTEYTDKGCLFDLLQGPKLNWEIICGIAIDIAEGLVCLKENDIVHGQLNSTRIFVTLDGRAKISEYGFKQIFERHKENHLIDIEIAYMAPEQLSDTPVFDNEGDKYSYGMICWEMITRLITGEHVIPYYSDEENYTNETDAIVKKKILGGSIPNIATRENAQVFTAPPKLGKLYRNICQTKVELRNGWDKIIEEWRSFDEENTNDPKRWKNCLQTDGEICPGEYANKKFKLVKAAEELMK